MATPVVPQTRRRRSADPYSFGDWRDFDPNYRGIARQRQAATDDAEYEIQQQAKQEQLDAAAKTKQDKENAQREVAREQIQTEQAAEQGAETETTLREDPFLGPRAVKKPKQRPDGTVIFKKADLPVVYGADGKPYAGERTEYGDHRYDKSAYAPEAGGKVETDKQGRVYRTGKDLPWAMVDNPADDADPRVRNAANEVEVENTKRDLAAQAQLSGRQVTLADIERDARSQVAKKAKDGHTATQKELEAIQAEVSLADAGGLKVSPATKARFDELTAREAEQRKNSEDAERDLSGAESELLNKRREKLSSDDAQASFLVDPYQTNRGARATVAPASVIPPKQTEPLTPAPSSVPTAQSSSGSQPKENVSSSFNSPSAASISQNPEVDPDTGLNLEGATKGKADSNYVAIDTPEGTIGQLETGRLTGQKNVVLQGGQDATKFLQANTKSKTPIYATPAATNVRWKDADVNAFLDQLKPLLTTPTDELGVATEVPEEKAAREKELTDLLTEKNPIDLYKKGELSWQQLNAVHESLGIPLPELPDPEKASKEWLAKDGRQAKLEEAQSRPASRLGAQDNDSQRDLTNQFWDDYFQNNQDNPFFDRATMIKKRNAAVDQVDGGKWSAAVNGANSIAAMVGGSSVGMATGIGRVGTRLTAQLALEAGLASGAISEDEYNKKLTALGNGEATGLLPADLASSDKELEIIKGQSEQWNRGFYSNVIKRNAPHYRQLEALSGNLFDQIDQGHTPDMMQLSDLADLAKSANTEGEAAEYDANVNPSLKADLAAYQATGNPAYKASFIAKMKATAKERLIMDEQSRYINDYVSTKNPLAQKWSQAFIGGQVAPVQELATEAAEELLTGGGAAVLKGIKGAAKAARASEALIDTTAAMTRASKVPAVFKKLDDWVESYAKLGIKDGAHIQNTLVTLAKQMPINSLSEAFGEGLSQLGQPGTTSAEIAQAAGIGALGGPLMAPVSLAQVGAFQSVASGVNYVRQRSFDKRLADSWNEANPTARMTPDDISTARALVSTEKAKAAAEEAKAIVDERAGLADQWASAQKLPLAQKRIAQLALLPKMNDNTDRAKVSAAENQGYEQQILRAVAQINGTGVAGRKLNEGQRNLAIGLVKISQGKPISALTAGEQKAVQAPDPAGIPAIRDVNGQTVITQGAIDQVKAISPVAGGLMRSEQARLAEIHTPVPETPKKNESGKPVTPSASAPAVAAPAVSQATPAAVPQGQETAPAAQPAAAAPVSGKDGAVAFSPEQKSLGIPRDQMPQVPAEARGALANFLKGKGIETNTETVSAKDLKPTQAEYFPEKVAKAKERMGETQRKLLVSSDGYLLDGHHQWLAHDPEDKVSVIRLPLQAKEALELLKEFPSTFRTGDTQNESTKAITAKPGPEQSGGTAVVPASTEKPTAQKSAAKEETASGKKEEPGLNSLGDALEKAEAKAGKPAAVPPETNSTVKAVKVPEPDIAEEFPQIDSYQRKRMQFVFDLAQQHAPLFPGGLRFSNEKWNGGGIGIDPSDNALVIYLPDLLTASTSPVRFEAKFRRAIIEEAIHGITIQLEQDGGLDVKRFWKAVPADLRALAEVSYNRGNPDGHKFDAYRGTHEIIRMYLQKKLDPNGTTEEVDFQNQIEAALSVNPSLAQMFRDLLEAFLSRVGNLKAELTSKDAQKTLDRLEEAVKARLEEIKNLVDSGTQVESVEGNDTGNAGQTPKTVRNGSQAPAPGAKNNNSRTDEPGRRGAVERGTGSGESGNSGIPDSGGSQDSPAPERVENPKLAEILRLPYDELDTAIQDPSLSQVDLMALGDQLTAAGDTEAVDIVQYELERRDKASMKQELLSENDTRQNIIKLLRKPNSGLKLKSVSKGQPFYGELREIMRMAPSIFRKDGMDVDRLFITLQGRGLDLPYADSVEFLNALMDALKSKRALLGMGPAWLHLEQAKAKAAEIFRGFASQAGITKGDERPNRSDGGPDSRVGSSERQGSGDANPGSRLPGQSRSDGPGQGVGDRQSTGLSGSPVGAADSGVFQLRENGNGGTALAARDAGIRLQRAVREYPGGESSLSNRGRESAASEALATPSEALTPAQRAWVLRFHRETPQLLHEEFLSRIDQDSVTAFLSHLESEAAGEGMKGALRINEARKTLKSFLEYKPSKASNPGKLRLIGVASEGAVFADDQNQVVYKFHAGDPAKSGAGISSIVPTGQFNPGETSIGIDRMPLTEVIRRYLRQNLVPAAVHTEIVAVTDRGALITRQPLLETTPKTDKDDITALMESAGAKAIKLDGLAGAPRAVVQNSWMVPDGEGNWLLAADVRPDNVLRQNGKPVLTDGILKSITPEVIKANPQLREYAPKRPDRLFMGPASADLFNPTVSNWNQSQHSALKAYKKLRKDVVEGKKLTPGQATTLTNAERILGQRFMFDGETDSTAAFQRSIPPPTVAAKAVQGGSVEEQNDIFDETGAGAAGVGRFGMRDNQGSLFAGAARPIEEDKDKSIAQLITENIPLAMSMANRFGNLVGKNGLTAEDIQQEGLQVLTRAALQWPKTMPFGAYAATSIRNRLIRLYQEAAKKDAPFSGQSLDDSIEGIEDATLGDIIPDERANVTRNVQRRESISKVRQAIDQLPEKPKKILQAMLSGKKAREIAIEDFGYGEGSANEMGSRLTQAALKRLKDKLEGMGVRGPLFAGSATAKPKASEMPGQKLLNPDSVKFEIGEVDSYVYEARENFDKSDPDTWPMDIEQISEWRDAVDSFDPEDPDTWNEFLSPDLQDGISNIDTAVDDLDTLLQSMRKSDGSGLEEGISKKAEDIAIQMQDQFKSDKAAIQARATQNAEYAKQVIAQVGDRAETWLAQPEREVENFDVDDEETWPLSLKADLESMQQADKVDAVYEKYGVSGDLTDEQTEEAWKGVAEKVVAQMKAKAGEAQQMLFAGRGLPAAQAPDADNQTDKNQVKLPFKTPPAAMSRGIRPADYNKKLLPGERPAAMSKGERPAGVPDLLQPQSLDGSDKGRLKAPSKPAASMTVRGQQGIPEPWKDEASGDFVDENDPFLDIENNRRIGQLIQAPQEQKDLPKNKLPDGRDPFTDAMVYVFAGQEDRAEHYSPGLKSVLQDGDRAQSLKTAALNALMDKMKADVRKAFGYPSFWRTTKQWLRLKRFTAEFLPTAACLEVDRIDEDGDFIFKPFYIRTGALTQDQANAFGLIPGMKFWQVPVKDEKTGKTQLKILMPPRGGEAMIAFREMIRQGGQEYTVGGEIPEDQGGGYLKLKYMPVGRQHAIYTNFRMEYPEMASAMLDRWITPALKDARAEGPLGQTTAEFNRYSLHGIFSESPFGSLDYVEGYTPDVSTQKTMMDSLVSMLSKYQSPGRKFKTGEARETGQVLDIFQGFQTRAMEAHREKLHAELRANIIEKAVIQDSQIPKGRKDQYVSVTEVIRDIAKLTRASKDISSVKFPNPHDALDPVNKAFLDSIMGDSHRFKNQPLSVHRQVHKVLVKTIAAQRSENIFLKIFDWFITRLTTGLLASLETLNTNIISNEIFKSIRLVNRVNYAFLEGMTTLVDGARGRKMDFSEAQVGYFEARNLFLGFFTDRSVGPGVLWNLVSPEKYRVQTNKERIGGLIPDELFNEQNALAAFGEDVNTSVIDSLKELNPGAAVLKFLRYGKWDVVAHQQISFASYLANAEVAYSAAVASGKMKKLERKAKREWMREWVKNAPQSLHREVRDTANLYVMDYKNVPFWLETSGSSAKNTLLKAIVPFFKFVASFVKQGKRTTYNAMVDLFGRNKTRKERMNGAANLMLWTGILALGTAMQGGGGDDEPIIGTSVDAEGNRLPGNESTANRINVSGPLRSVAAFFKMHGIDILDDLNLEESDYWMTYRKYPYFREAAVLGILGKSAMDASRDLKEGKGLSAATGTFFNGKYGQFTEAASDFVSEMGVSGILWKLANIMQGNRNKYETNMTDSWLYTATLSDLATAPLIPPPVLRTVKDFVDPVNRRRIPAEQTLEYDADGFDALKSKIPFLSRTLPAAGYIKKVDPTKKDVSGDLAQLEALGGGAASVNPYIDPETGKPKLAYVDPFKVQKTPLKLQLLKWSSGMNIKPFPSKARRNQVDPYAQPSP